MRNGNREFFISYLNLSTVLTVPMRNGNFRYSGQVSICRDSSYRTYEEWKQTLSQTVQEVQTRSYRTYEEWKQTTSGWYCVHWWGFLPYLWGMETPEIVAQAPNIYVSFLPYLWGMETNFGICFFVCLIIPFLPYLWGMETRISVLRTVMLLRSYRTYEEWKPLHVSILKTSSLCSYRTYEEWKQRMCLLFRQTYLVLTVPMRNGNLDTPISLANSIWLVLTVPMRNGNIDKGYDLGLLNLGSYRTYEEWKHLVFISLPPFKLTFLPYLWGMET